MIYMEILLMLFLALVIDIILGEPPNFIHPVAWMGKSTIFLEKIGVGQPPLAQFIYGTVMALFLVGLFTTAAFLILFYLKNLSVIAYVVIGAMLLKSTFSLKGLRKAALRVKSALVKDRLDEARYELRSLVSRDTQHLSKPLLVSAAVESVAESSCDSFVAPLFYFLLFGVPGAIAYRMVNTLDSMVGYHEQYEYLGKFSSRLDDILNFIPARLTALILVLASIFSGRGVRGSWEVALNEHTKTESPNAGWTIAAMAGALNIRLKKTGQYKIGRPGSLLVPDTIDASLRLLAIAGLIWVTICFITGGIYFALTT